MIKTKNVLQEFHISAHQVSNDELHHASSNSGHIRAFVGHLKDFKKDITTLSKSLSTKELQRAGKFAFDLHRDVYIVSHALLKSQLSKSLKLPIKDVKIEYFDGTKPHSKNSPSIDFNLSHSQEYFAFILGDKSALRVGIDVEKINPAFEIQSIIENYMHPNEIAYIQNKWLNKNEKQNRFYEIWTRKEAFLKMQGIGIVTDLTSFDTASTKSTSSFQVPDSIHIQSNTGTIYSYCHPLYSLSIAVSTSKRPVLIDLK